VGKQQSSSNLGNGIRRAVGFLDTRLDSTRRNCLSFTFDFVASDFFSPAWRNWQTRWTQNSEIADLIWLLLVERQSRFS
jgi:hypothetical protein